MDTYSCHIYTDMLFSNNTSLRWSAHVWWGLSLLIKLIFLEYLCSHSELILMTNMIQMTLVQMHAPSLEAVNPITLFGPSSSSICLRNPFFPAVILSEERGRTSTQRGWRATRNRRWASFLFHGSLSGEQACSHLLSSPPALTMKRSPVVKRTLVRWAEWPRKRLCLAWNGRLSQSTTGLVACY